MNRQFGRREDPFSTAAFRTKARLGGAGRPRRRWGRAGAGCAEGHFTERLVRLADRVTALDISSVALARARRRVTAAEFQEADLLAWSPPPGTFYDAIVLGDVLYYLDRRGVAAEFEALFARVVSWLRPAGRLLLAHGFGGAAELAHRRSFRERFEAAGLTLVREAPVEGAQLGGVRCLLCVLESR